MFRKRDDGWYRKNDEVGKQEKQSWYLTASAWAVLLQRALVQAFGKGAWHGTC